MKTTVEVDNSKLELIREMGSEARTKEEIVDLALEELISIKSRQRLRAMRGTGWDGDLDKMRTAAFKVETDKPDKERMSYDEALRILDAARGPDLWKGDLEDMRKNKFRS